MSKVHHHKRSASEPVDALLGREYEIEVTEKRPASIALGAILVFARALAGIAWIIGFSLLWNEIAAEAEVDSESAPYVYWIIVGSGAIGVLVLLVLAWAIWRGSNIARVLVMFGLTLSTITAATGYFVAGEEITIQTTLLTLALDILVLLALSGRDARAWARGSAVPLTATAPAPPGGSDENLWHGTA